MRLQFKYLLRTRRQLKVFNRHFEDVMGITANGEPDKVSKREYRLRKNIAILRTLLDLEQIELDDQDAGFEGTALTVSIAISKEIVAL